MGFAYLHGQGTLSPRETEVLRLVAEGCTNKQIAQMLIVQPDTVKNHLVNIYVKLGAMNRAQAVAIAYRRHLLDREETAGP